MPQARDFTSQGSAGPPAVVLGGEAIPLPVVRSLGAAGIEVHAAGGDPAYDPVGWSRHCASYTDLGDRDGAVERMFEWLSSDAPRGAVVLPCSDDGLEMVLRYRSELEALGHFPIEADSDVLAAMLDKVKTYELARGIGIQTPSIQLLTEAADLDGGLDGIGYPCALKPRHSHHFAKHFRTTKLIVAKDPFELAGALRRTDALGLEMIVTEIIPGPETELLSCCGYIDQHGEPLTHFTFRKIRQHPVQFGQGSYVVSDWNQEVIAEALRFLRGVGLRGLFHVEFKRDPRDGGLKLLECNHRFTIEAMLAPVDLPLLTYNRILGRPLPADRPYRSGVHLWAPYMDARAFRIYRSRGELTWGSWLRSLLRRQRLHIFRWDDPLPSLYAQLALAGRWLGRRLRGSRPAPATPVPLDEDQRLDL